MYCEAWARIFELATVFASAADEVQHGDLTGHLPPFEPLAHYANCHLFASGGGRTVHGFHFALLLYGAPLATVIQCDELYTERVAGTIRLPAPNGLESWYPHTFQSLVGDYDDDDAPVPYDVPNYRAYQTVVLRMVFLLRSIKTMAEISTDEDAAAQKRKLAQEHESMLYVWLDALLMFCIAIDELGYVPRDDSPEMAVLFERYSHDVHMAFTESELPDLSRDIRTLSIFNNANEDGTELCNMIKKAWPERCGTRETAMKVADKITCDASLFAAFKLFLPALYLGIYSTSKYRCGWRMRWGVYRLHFFRMDARLRGFCRLRTMPDGAQLYGGTAAYLAHQYNLNDLHDSMRIDEQATAAPPLPPVRAVVSSGKSRSRALRARARKTFTNIQFRHYPTIVAMTYRAEMSGDAPRRRARSGNAPPPPPPPQQQSMKMPIDGGGPPSSPPGQRAPAKKAVPKLRDAAMRNLTSARTAEPRQGLAIDVNSTLNDNDFLQGLYVANAVGRLTVEQNRGVLYYEQRKEVYVAAAEATAPVDAPSPAAEVLPPYEPGERIKYRDAQRRMIAEDRRVPDLEDLQADCILFHALSSIISRRADGKTAVEKEYTYQNTINLALREFLIFALDRWNEALLNELCARTDWAQWQLGNHIVADALRHNLDALYAVPGAKLGAYLTSYGPYERMKEATGDTARSAIVNNLYTVEKEPFLPAMLRMMTTLLNNDGYADVRVDHVMPTETPLMLRHLLMYWRYPRYAPPLALADIRRANEQQQQQPSSPNDTGGRQSTQQLHEYSMPAQISFLIEPTTRLPDANASAEEIREQFVRRAHFPLRLFHVDEVTIMEFQRHRHIYHMTPGDPVITSYIEPLAKRSIYQFMVMYTYLQAIAVHMSLHTWPLPRHIVDHQLRTLRSHYCVPANQPVPRHLLKTLVCIGCQRCSAVMPTARKQQSVNGNDTLGAGVDIGCDQVRWVAETDDDIVFEAVRKRGGALLPLEALLPADSWTRVLHHRARLHRRPYDRYCTESQEESEELLAHPEQYGNYLPVRATEAQIDERSARLFGSMFDEENVARYATPTDVRQLIKPLSKPGAPLHLVASGRGKLGELDFDERLADEANKRISLYIPEGSNMRSFQMWGHALEGRDPRYDTVRWVDATQRMKAESKKTKQLDNSRRTIDGIVEHEERATSLRTFDAKRRRDAQSMARVAQCSREQMLEVDLLGRALVQEQIFIVGRTPQAATGDFLMACCDCLGKIRGSEAYPIGDRVVCRPCYYASQARGGVVAKRTVRGESTKSVATARLTTLTAESAELMRQAPSQRMLSPSFKALHSLVVPNGTPCAMDRCRTVKSDVHPMYGLQVLRDIDVGNESYGWIFFCKKHAALYAQLFKSPFVVPLSSIKVFMLEGVRRFDMNITSGNFLDRYLRRAAQSAHMGTIERHKTELAKRSRRLTTQKRIQRQTDAAHDVADAQAAIGTAQQLGAALDE